MNPPRLAELEARLRTETNPARQATIRQSIIEVLFSEFCAALQPAVICDIGSCNAGDALAFRRAVPAATVLAFEANHRNYLATLQQVDLAAHRIFWEYMAITDTDGVVDFHLLPVSDEGYDWRSGASSILPHSHETSERVVVAARRLDSVLAERGLIDAGKALWIDVEGVADRVIRGAGRSLENTLFLKVEVEAVAYWHGQSVDRDVLPIIEAAGFVPVFSSRTEGVGQYDMLYVSRRVSGLLSTLQGLDALNGLM